MARRLQGSFVLKRIYKPDPVAEMKAVALVLGIPWSAIGVGPLPLEKVPPVESAESSLQQPEGTIPVPDAL